MKATRRGVVHLVAGERRSECGILPVIIGDRPNEIYHHVMQRCAKLEHQRKDIYFGRWKLKWTRDTQNMSLRAHPRYLSFENELWVAPVALSLMLIPEELSEDASSESVTLSQLESSPVIMPSPTLSGRSSFTCEAPARVIRHYIPGRALFGEGGSGLAPL